MTIGEHMNDPDYTTHREEFYGDEPSPPAAHLVVWVALIGASLGVWGSIVWLVIHLI